MDKNFCCGKKHSSNFCPNCGKQLHPDDSLFGLLRHCRQSASKSQIIADQEGAKDQQKQIAQKWKKWVELLEIYCKNEV